MNEVPVPRLRQSVPIKGAEPLPMATAVLPIIQLTKPKPGPPLPIMPLLAPAEVLAKVKAYQREIAEAEAKTAAAPASDHYIVSAAKPLMSPDSAVPKRDDTTPDTPRKHIYDINAGPQILPDSTVEKRSDTILGKPIKS